MRNFWVHHGDRSIIVAAAGYSIGRAGTLEFWVPVLWKRKIILSIAAQNWHVVHADGAYDWDVSGHPTRIRSEQIRGLIAP